MAGTFILAPRIDGSVAGESTPVSSSPLGLGLSSRLSLGFSLGLGLRPDKVRTLYGSFNSLGRAPTGPTSHCCSLPHIQTLPSLVTTPLVPPPLLTAKPTTSSPCSGMQSLGPPPFPKRATSSPPIPPPSFSKGESFAPSKGRSPQAYIEPPSKVKVRIRIGVRVRVSRSS